MMLGGIGEGEWRGLCHNVAYKNIIGSAVYEWVAFGAVTVGQQSL
jgi:hypothetical protein